MSNKADKNYWDASYKKTEFTIAPEGSLLRTWIEKYIPRVNDDLTKTCIEVGCYPGTYLAVFGELGYTISGIDFTENINLIPQWMKEKGYKTGDFYKEDFLNFNIIKQYDVVVSLGFIEHFTDWEEILKKHILLVKEKGFLVIEAPNFIGGFQNWFHKYLDKENYDRHHIPAMDIEKWAEILERENFIIIFKRYFGKFDYWRGDQQRTIFQNVLLILLNKIYPLLSSILPANKKLYSPVGGIIAIKE